MKRGEMVIRRPQTFCDSESSKKAMKGRVVYIHPAGRYHTEEFDTPGGPIRECFQGVE